MKKKKYCFQFEFILHSLTYWNFIIFPQKFSSFYNGVVHFHIISETSRIQHGFKMAWWCSPMVQETWVQSQVESYQRLKKWYLMPSCLTLSIIRYRSRVKWSNAGKGLVPLPTPWCCSYRKRNLQVTHDYGRQLYFTYSLGCMPPASLQRSQRHTHTHTHLSSVLGMTLNCVWWWGSSPE